MTKAVFIPLIKAGWTSGVICTFPIKREKIIVVVARLTIEPTIRMVPREPEARPKYRFSTELIIALILGEEKRAKPKPRMMRDVII